MTATKAYGIKINVEVLCRAWILRNDDRLLQVVCRERTRSTTKM